MQRPNDAYPPVSPDPATWPRLVPLNEGCIDVDRPIEEEFGLEFLTLVLKGGQACSS